MRLTARSYLHSIIDLLEKLHCCFLGRERYYSIRRLERHQQQMHGRYDIRRFGGTQCWSRNVQHCPRVWVRIVRLNLNFDDDKTCADKSCQFFAATCKKNRAPPRCRCCRHTEGRVRAFRLSSISEYAAFVYYFIFFHGFLIFLSNFLQYFL